MVWNHDHTESNAKCSWVYDPSAAEDSGYGSGPTRQLVLEDKVEFYHPNVKSSLHMYAPKINPNQGMYLYQIYPGTSKTAPIIIWGNLIPRPVKFEDRLHLKLVQPEEFNEKFRERVDHGTVTRKFDGASTFFHSKPGPGTKLFSPRISKVTGYPIEYTYKVPEIANIGSSHRPVGMGELLFWRYTVLGRTVQAISGIRLPEFIGWKYTSAAETGGILNSGSVRERSVYPELRLYRIDEWDGIRTYDLQFGANRILQRNLSKELSSPYVKVVTLVRPAKTHQASRWEGFVGVPPELSVNDALKVKWWADANDWQVTSVDLEITEKGSIGGVVWFKSLESGKMFKLGPGQLGDTDRCMEFIENPESMINTVWKVHGRQGHEGRAAKVIEPHLDKGG